VVCVERASHPPDRHSRAGPSVPNCEGVATRPRGVRATQRRRWPPLAAAGRRWPLLATAARESASARTSLRPRVIVLEELSVHYDGVCAVSSVTSTVATGEWVALIGPNGAGKTSLLRSIAGLVDYRGSIRLGGVPLAELGRRRLSQLVSYVPQNPEIPADMTVADYVLLGRTPHISYLGSEGAGDRRAASDVLERLALSALADRELDTLSGGELQRLVLARALAQEAPILLLDEPTSALDLGRRVEALELVDSLRRERELTVVSAMHDLTLAGQFAQRLLLLVDGRVAADGPPPVVLDEQLLAARFGHGVTVLRTPEGEIVVVPTRRRS
jgi:iron complex transport system ATP-binding protein